MIFRFDLFVCFEKQITSENKKISPFCSLRQHILDKMDNFMTTHVLEFCRTNALDLTSFLLMAGAFIIPVADAGTATGGFSVSLGAAV
jgi:hypothetical protein